MSRAPGRTLLLDSTRGAMQVLFESARAIDIRHFEASSSEEVARHLSPQVRSLVEQASALASDILRRSEADAEAAKAVAPEGSNFELAVDTLLADSGDSKIADLAFMAVTELRQRLTRLRVHGPDCGAWEMVCECASALRRVQKSLAALEQALCEAEGAEPSLRFDSELQTSLQVRRQYRKLLRFVSSFGPVGPDNVRNALRGAGTLCAMLVGRDIYCRLRERDRFELRQLQRRILAWLPQEPCDLKAGVRLWEDYAGFVEMLRQVSQRQELVQHDTATLRAAQALLRADELASAREVLARIEGLDDGLDEALAASAPAEVLAREVARVLGRYLAPSSTSSSASPF